MTDFAHDMPRLRYNRFGGGYRREDVEAALEQLLYTMRAVEADLSELRVRSAELEGELGEARLEIEAYRAREEHLRALIDRAEALLAPAGQPSTVEA
jgi:chromosome segregation ATPase